LVLKAEVTIFPFSPSDCGIGLSDEDQVLMIKKVMSYFRRKKIAMLPEGAQEFLLALAGLAGTASGSC